MTRLVEIEGLDLAQLEGLLGTQCCCERAPDYCEIHDGKKLVRKIEESRRWDLASLEEEKMILDDRNEGLLDELADWERKADARARNVEKAEREIEVLKCVVEGLKADLKKVLK